MKRNATESINEPSAKADNHAGMFSAVRDTRKRKIKGLWQRRGILYARMRVKEANGRSKDVRIPLVATTLDDAKVEIEKLRTDRVAETIHLPGHRPKFSELVEEYKKSAVFLSKKIGTQKNESQSLNRWIEQVGGIRCDWIKADAITTFHDKRKDAGLSNRTINLDTVAFNNCMKYAVERKWITNRPKLAKLKEKKPPRRPLLSKGQIDSLLEKATVSKNAEQFRLYVRFLAATGAREKEALRVRKIDVDTMRGVLRIGGDGDTKSGLGRDIQFNATLRDLMAELMAALPDDTTFLFPSPQRGKADKPSKSFRESLRLVRIKAGLPWVGFHDLRHYFASACVMAGIDYMTTAKWLGHQDGGILVGKVYGHLNDAHQRSAAEKLTF